MGITTMQRPGRNDPCPCGSNKKFKKCHGSAAAQEQLHRQAEIAVERARAQRIQVERQQGLGRQIISDELKEWRFVAVNDRVITVKGCKTFHDFLLRYLPMTFGYDWGAAEELKPAGERHPVVVWYHHVLAQRRKALAQPGPKIQSVPMTSGAAAYYRLAYDLYALEHNVELREILLSRLRGPDLFLGARYEVFVAAALVRAGFTLAFEDENDHRRTHVEFTATYPATGKKFSVEAKEREGALKPGRRLHRAMKKVADFERVIFIDLDTPAAGDDMQSYLMRTLALFRRFETKRILNGELYPPAYLFLTNSPWLHDLEGAEARTFVFADGFRIPDFKHDVPMTLHDAIDARARHREMHGLLASLKEHAGIPATFDGQIPELAFAENQPCRLLIGERYNIPHPDGGERPAVLDCATVDEQKRLAICGMRFDDDKAVIYNFPLTEEEMAAWARYPDVFFGQVGQRKTKVDTPMELFDFFHSSYRETPRDRLLSFMSDWPDLEAMRSLDQPALARAYCERCVESVVAQNAASMGGRSRTAA